MLKKTDCWICDHCDDLIERAEDGIVEWIDMPHVDVRQKRRRGLRIVHRGDLRNGTCVYKKGAHPLRIDEAYGFEHLHQMMDQDGLMRLLIMLHEKQFEDSEQVYEVIKRIHIQGYEEARRHIAEAISSNMLEERGPMMYPFADEIEAVLRMMREHSDDIDESVSAPRSKSSV